MVSIDGLTKSYGRLTAVADVSLSIRQGEVLALIGPNGSGKTTLFECIAGLLPYESGTVSMDGTALAPPRARVAHLLPAGRHCAVARADGPLGARLRERILRPGRREAVRELARRVVQRLDLGPLLGSPIGTLSKGQRKRVLLAVGMLTPHPLLLADEPFDGLDLRQTREVGAALREHAATGRTLFLSIHQINDAARVCDRFVLLSGGRIRGEGTLEQLAARTLLRPVLRLLRPPRLLEEIFLALT